MDNMEKLRELAIRAHTRLKDMGATKRLEDCLEENENFSYLETSIYEEIAQES